jgi:hypothetical protein
MPAPEVEGVAAPTEIVVGFVVLPAIVTAWLVSIEIAVVPLVWSANTPEESALDFKPAEPRTTN